MPASASAIFREKLTLVIALLIDFIGIISYLIPTFGELFDAFWAPLSAILVFLLFGRKWGWAGFTFVEELFPFTDVIPSATIAWYFHKQRKSKEIKKQHVGV
jgi:hypothetical protein